MPTSTARRSQPCSVRPSRPQYGGQGTHRPGGVLRHASDPVGFFTERDNAVVWRGPMIHKLLQQFL